jgi:hypothetical protein
VGTTDVRLIHWRPLAVAIGLCAAGAAPETHSGAQARETPVAPAGESDTLIAAGGRLYSHGVTASGVAVPVTVQGDLRVRSTDMPCANCHRRSGWGTVEGGVTTPPVVGEVLFNPIALGNAQLGIRTTGPGTRPAYDDQLLLRALRDGIDPSGRPLSLTMPRYQLGAADAAALSAYLRSLPSTPPPGVTPETVHLATITSSTVDAGKRAALLDVLRAFVTSKNGGTRNETRRRDHGPWDMKSRYENYRGWELHEWSLQGHPAEWPAQLAAHYARQPVFAVVSGLADGDWTPVHEFCEQTHVPCVFPQTAAPPVATIDDGVYSFYFSKGLALEAATLAHHLKSGMVAGGQGTLLQVLRCGGPAESAARQLSRSSRSGHAIRTRCVEPGAPLTAAVWGALLAEAPAIVVPWLDGADLAAVASLISETRSLRRVPQIFLSSSLLGDDLTTLPRPPGTAVYLIEPFVAAHEFDRHASRSLIWIKRQGIHTRHQRIAVNALFAASIVGDALAVPRTLQSREYFIEQIEHMVARSPLPSAYPALSLGPQRRVASLGSFVLRAAGPGEPLTTVGQWLVPDYHREENR